MMIREIALATGALLLITVTACSGSDGAQNDQVASSSANSTEGDCARACSALMPFANRPDPACMAHCVRNPTEKRNYCAEAVYEVIGSGEGTLCAESIPLCAELAEQGAGAAGAVCMLHCANPITALIKGCVLGKSVEQELALPSCYDPAAKRAPGCIM